MRPFDAHRYEQQVVRPLRGRTGALPDDLLARYAVEPDMDSAALAARMAEVRRLWAARAPVGGYLGSVYTAFRVADLELVRTHGDALLDISWWRGRAAAPESPPRRLAPPPDRPGSQPPRWLVPPPAVPTGATPPPGRGAPLPMPAGERPPPGRLAPPPGPRPAVPAGVHPDDPDDPAPSGRDIAPEAESQPAPPPPPAEDVAVQPTGVGVTVTWHPPAVGEPIGYRVVRRPGRVPATPADGDTVGETATTSLVDPTPPAGRPLGYAVFVQAAGPAWSAAAGAMATVLPPVDDVQVRGERGAVVGRWTAHPDVVDVQVRRRTATGEPDRDAVLVPSADARTFRDDTVRTGTEYEYSLTARYGAQPDEGRGKGRGDARSEGTRRLRAATVVVRCAPRPDAAPVADLRAEPVESGGPVAVRLSWWQPVGAEVQVRRSASPSPHGYGESVPAAEREAFGTLLPAPHRIDDGTMDLTVDVPPGRWWFTAFTLTDGGALRGQDAVADVVEAVDGLEARRRGDEITLGWVWPQGVSVAEVAWSAGVRRVTLRQYIDDGFRVVAGPEAELFEVRVVAPVADGSEIFSAAAVVEVAAAPPAVTYTVVHEGGLLRRSSRRLVVTLSADRGVPGCEVVLIAAPGQTMPREPEFGEELLRETVDLDPEAGPTRLEAPRPRLSRPYWVRCFLLGPDGVRFVDPPVSQLKVT